MGFFSWECSKCDKSAISYFAIDETGINTWMTQVAILTKDGGRWFGEYDGYGRVGENLDLNELNGKFELYHKSCWEKAGKPDFAKEAEYASDQGYFFDDKADGYLKPDPMRREL